MTISEKLIKIAENEPKVYESGVEKGKSELAESIDPLLDGNLATLDEMLALQETLITPTPTPTLSFSLYLYDHDETLNYEEGMTWEDWVNSEYNTISAQIIGGNVYISYPDAIIEFSTGCVAINSSFIDPNNNYYIGIFEI